MNKAAASVVCLATVALGLTFVQCTLANPLGYLQGGGTSAACDTTATGSDAKNCGACGHDCQGGTCQAGACQPVELAANLTSPFDLAVDTSSVYFTLNDADAGAVIRCSLDGCDAGMNVLSANEPNATRIVIDQTHAYWTSYGNGYVHACPLAGCDGAVTTYATGQPNAEGIAVNASTLFWGENTSNGAISSCPLSGSGCPAAGPAVLASAPGAGTLAVSGNDLFWVVNPHGDGKVEECDTSGCDGGNPYVFAAGGNAYGPYFVAVYNGEVYWTDQETSGGIYTCPITGCVNGPAPIATENAPYGLAVDASGVYWGTSSSLGVIRRCPLTGCNGEPPITLAVGQNVPFALALTDTSVLWTTTQGGTVMKVAKPVVAP